MKSLMVLLYNHVAPDREVTPEGFDAQIGWLKDQGYRSLTLTELEARLTGTSPSREKSVVITFDDAYADAWVYAHPILSKHGMKAVLFVPTAFPSMTGTTRPTSAQGGSLDETRLLEHGPEGFLTWAELRAMAESGTWELGSHTHTHKAFDRQAGYRDLDEEIALSRSVIESRIGHPCTAMAWPWGEYDKGWLAALAQHGYRLAFTRQDGANWPGEDLLQLKRLKVRQSALSWLKDRMTPRATPAQVIEERASEAMPPRRRRTAARKGRPKLKTVSDS
jgi:peptidoglycan/xylan/chitin deacetylase (PgdA/CDA1 family)